MDAKTLISLADRCEKATGGDRELDAEIEIECGRDGPRIREIMAGSPHNTIDEVAKAADREDSGVFFRVPCYTASLDAAMSLYIDLPTQVPSNPRLATAEALRQRAEAV